MQAPVALQVSTCVHGLPSLHAVPAGNSVPWQTPPAPQTSVAVHEFPSSHAVPAARVVDEQCPLTGSQVSVVQELASSQPAAVVHPVENGSADDLVKSKRGRGGFSTPIANTGTFTKRTPPYLLPTPSWNQIPSPRSRIMPPRTVFRSPLMNTPLTLLRSMKFDAARLAAPRNATASAD